MTERDALEQLLADFMGVREIAKKIDRIIDATALAAVGKPGEVRASAAAWLRNEVVAGLSTVDGFSGKDISPIADFIAARLAKRIAEIEASGAGRA